MLFINNMWHVCIVVQRASQPNNNLQWTSQAVSPACPMGLLRSAPAIQLAQILEVQCDAGLHQEGGEDMAEKASTDLPPPRPDRPLVPPSPAPLPTTFHTAWPKPTCSVYAVPECSIGRPLHQSYQLMNVLYSTFFVVYGASSGSRFGLWCYIYCIKEEGPQFNGKTHALHEGWSIHETQLRHLRQQIGRGHPLLSAHSPSSLLFL